MRTHVLILSLFLLCITCNYLYNRKITENMIEDNGKMTCPTNNDYLDKYKAWSIESQRSSDIVNTQKDVKDMINKNASDLEKISKESIKKLSKWILKPENVFTWNIDRDDIIGNEVVISSTKPISNNRALKIGNIQVWGTGIYSAASPDTTEQDWAKHKDTKVKLSSNDGNPTLLHNITNNIVFKKGNEENDESDITCDNKYTMTSCSCYSDSGSCEGASIIGKTCTAKSKKCGGKVQARAVCVKFDGSEININSTNEKKSTTGESKVEVKCTNPNQVMTSCNCKASKQYKGNNQLCKGANIERDNENNPICTAYKNIDDFAGNGQIKAVATCATIKGSKLRYTKHNSKNKSSISNLGENAKSIAKCKYNEKLIGCNCYSNPNDSNMNNICRGVTIEGNTDKICIAESIHNTISQNERYPVYADATCAQFDVNSKNCTNDILYTYDNDNDKVDNSCKTKSTDTEQTITVTLPKNVNIKKIIIYSNTFHEDETSTDLYPIEVRIKKNGNLSISKICTKTDCTEPNCTKIECAINEPNPELPPEIQSVKPNFYLDNENNLIDNTDKFKGWHNTHSVNYKSYCRLLKDKTESPPMNYLDCIDPFTGAIMKYNDISTADNRAPFMKDVTGNGLDDYCYCNKDRLMYLKNNGDKFLKDNLYVIDNNSKYCKTGNKKLINNVRSTLLNCKNEYDKNENEKFSIDASFYNKHNQKYYIFKNIRMDGKKYVMFCEVGLDHKISEDYPQFMSKDYWGNIPDTFYNHIDETIYSGVGSVYFISGSDVCEVNINGDKFSVKQKKSIEDTFNITEENKEFKENIKTGFYRKDTEDNYVLIKDNKYIINENNINTTSSEHISNLLDPTNNNNINYDEIRTILHIYGTNTPNNTYLFMNNKIIEYNLNENKIENESDFYSDLIGNLNWNIPLIPQVVKPSPIVTST